MPAVAHWRSVAARWAYSALTTLAQPLLRRKLARRGRAEPGYLAHVPERFGHYTQPAGQGYVWVHAVSLGETRAAALLIERLRALRPGMRLLLTHGTATGRAEGLRCLRDGDIQVWQPWDTPQAVRRFLRHFQPVVGVLMETEVWPNLVHGCRQAGIPLLLVNARLSEKSLHQAQRLASLSQVAFASLTAAYAQTEADALRLRALGAPVAGVYGNLKFDVPPRPQPWSIGRAWRGALHGRPVWMLASSRDGEEALWSAALHRQHRAEPADPNVFARRPLWLLVPRHPQRFDAVAQLLQDDGWRVFRRSALSGWDGVSPLPVDALNADIWLGDSLGEMPLYYGLAQAALLGGSFLPLGGQNLIEAAACECPVIMGPHTFNFAEAAQWAEAEGAAVRVADMDAALALTSEWGNHPQERQSAETACGALLSRGAGAAGRYAQAVAAYISGSEGR